MENSWPQDLDNFSNFSTTAEILVKFNFSCQITSHYGENTAWPVWEISDDVKKGGCGDFSTGDFFWRSLSGYFADLENNQICAFVNLR